MTAPSTTAATGLDALRFGSGHTVRRIEDPTLVAGQGRYTDDLQREGLAHLVFVRSPHAHPRLLSVDSPDARALPRRSAVHNGPEPHPPGVTPTATPPPKSHGECAWIESEL